MTVASEACYAERAWTGGQTSFAAGFTALDINYVKVRYRDGLGAVTTLTPGLHCTIVRDALSGAISVVPLAAMPAAPGTVMIERHTPATQDTDLVDGASYSAETHERIADIAAMRSAEHRRDYPAIVTPNLAAVGKIAFAGYRLAGAAPADADDFVTKAHFDEFSGQALVDGASATLNAIVAGASATFNSLAGTVTAEIAAANSSFAAQISGLHAEFDGDLTAADAARIAAEAARDAALGYRNTTLSYRDETLGYRDDALDASAAAFASAALAEQIAIEIGAVIDLGDFDGLSAEPEIDLGDFLI
jgi:hypothetical protein